MRPGAVRQSIKKHRHVLGNAHTGNPLSPEHLAQHNRIALDYFREVESKHYRKREASDRFRQKLGLPALDWPEGLPRACVALSAGGIRSASFSIGVLQALEENQMLSGVDIISAASGGAYASSWFYAQQHFDGVSSAQLLSAESAHIKSESAQFHRHRKRPVDRPTLAISSGVGPCGA